ncbi:MAG: methionine--tRNA ligase [Bacilli bacterium]|nr:methionine--tRNA ligase [Bacilli bacterium]
MKVFIGGAWPYANNSLHVGHLAALLPGDVIARYYRMKGDKVIYVSGTDAHGTPITVRAKNEGIKPEDIAIKYHEEFTECFNRLNFSYDLYTITSDEYHKKEVVKYFELLLENGYIYEKTEEQDFCEECNQYLSDREIEGICPYCSGLAKGDQCDECLTTINAKELLEKKCKACGTHTAQKGNTHLYFKLSSFQNEIQELVDNSKEKWRLNAINESIKYLKNGLLDRAATRQLDWGVNTPVKGFEDKKIYVWIEAVLGYLTAGKKYSEDYGIDFTDFMTKSDDLITYYVHGKDNIPFHTIIFPALLLGLKNNFQLPDYILSSNYVNMNNEKISKSKGNGIIVKDLIDTYQSDTIRYYMIANGPETKDTNFSYEVLEHNHNKHLVGEYGNFVNRNLAFLVKKFEGIIPEGKMDLEIDEIINKSYSIVGELISRGELRQAIDSALNLVQIANKYYDNQKPWIQAKESLIDFNNTTFTCINLMANIANILEPFMPDSSKQVKNMLGIKTSNWSQLNIEGNRLLNNVDIIFDKIESSENDEITQLKRSK